MDFVSPNEEELAAVERLKAQLSEELNKDESTKSLSGKFTDTKILRFHRGLKRDEEKALESLKKNAQFTIEDDVLNIHTKTEFFEKELNAKKVIVLDGLDHNQRPVSVCYAHRHKANDRDIAQIRMLIIHTLETLIAKAKPEEEKFVICFDLSKFTFACMDYEAVKALISILQSNYPDTLHCCLIIDSPMIFSTCWYIIRPWLDAVTAAKVSFIKRAQLKDYLDPELVSIDP